MTADNYLWRSGVWGDGSTKPGEALIFHDASEVMVAGPIPSEMAKLIVDYHNELIRSQQERVIESAKETLAAQGQADDHYRQLMAAKERVETAERHEASLTRRRDHYRERMIAAEARVKALEGALQLAASTAYRICAETRHVTLGNKAREAILALSSAPPRGGKPLWQQDEERIKKLMEQVGFPNSMSLFQAFKQFGYEVRLEALSRSEPNAPEDALAKAVGERS